MGLREELRIHGNWLFRYRSYLPLLFLPIILIQVRHLNFGPYYQLDQISEWVYLAISLFGLGIRMVTIGHVPRGTSGKNTTRQVADALNTSGIYSVVRHPLYLGNFFMWLGIILFARSWWLVLVFMLTYWIYYERIMYVEEEFLQEKFGAVYTEWAAKTRAFLPKFSNWRSPDLPFSWRVVLKQEYRGLCGTIFIFILLKVFSDYQVSGELEHGWLWVGLFGGNMLLYIIIYYLSKKTQVLRVKDR